MGIDVAAVVIRVAADICDFAGGNVASVDVVGVVQIALNLALLARVTTDDLGDQLFAAPLPGLTGSVQRSVSSRRRASAATCHRSLRRRQWRCWRV